MSGLIEIDKNRTWSVAGWVFDHVVRLTRNHLPEEGSSNILKLMDRAATGLNHICLEELSADEKSIFLDALEAAHLEAKTAGSRAFADPEFYPGFMQRFEELLTMVRKNE